MTMHLARGLTTLNTKKRKAKKRKSADHYIAGWRKQNKFYKEKGLDMMTLDDYIDYVHGVYKPKQELRAVQTPWHHTESSYRRETKHVPSHTSDNGIGTATKKPSMQYTGERKLVGIAMMHKSNLVPVFADDDDKTGSKQATEIAQMRRN
tara:strand:- start:8139 stop:8588 length:450 start_codon:yes stop_codon:yes gene_type:complete